MRISRWAAGLVAVLLVSCTVARAQSLGDVAKKEEERRKAIKAPSKVITEEDLKKFGPLPPPQPASTAAAQPAPAGQANAVADKDKAEDKDKAADDAKDEAAWKKRMSDAREQLDRNKSFLEALQSRVNALTTDFYARDDPAQRAELWSQRTKALDEMERIKKEMVDQQKAISDIEEEARKAGIPAGWLR